MKKCYIYARSATSSHLETSFARPCTIDRQITECKEFAEKHGFRILKVFEDSGCSGNNLNRSAFQKLMVDSIKNPSSTLIVYRADRLSRNFTDYKKILLYLEEKGIKVISITDCSLERGFLNE